MEWVDPLGVLGRRAAFKQARRDARAPVSQQSGSIVKVPMTTRGGCPVIYDGKRVEIRGYIFAREDGSKVVIQDYSAGHNFGEGGIGDQNSHFNVRPQENTRTGSVPGTAAHYPFGRE